MIAAALLLALSLVWPVGSPSVEAERYLAGETQAVHPGPNLVRYPPLDRLARWRAEDMGVNEYFSHTMPDGTKFWQVLDRFGVRKWRAAGEVLAWNNYPPSMSPDAAWDAWGRSPGHWNCITSGAYDAFGVGSYRAEDGRMLYAMVFTDQPERKAVRRLGLWLRRSPGGEHVTRLPYGTRLVVFNNRHDSRGNWFYVYAAGRYGWVAGWNTRSTE